MRGYVTLRHLLAAVAVALCLGTGSAAGAPSPTPAADPASGSTVLVVDTSGSMQGANFRAAVGALRSYVAQVPDGVKVGLISFSDDPRVVVRPTADHDRVVRAMEALRIGGKTSLYDSVLAGLRIAGREGTRNIVLLTDGHDTSSRSSLAATVREVARSDVRVDAVDVRPGHQPGRELSRLARAGNGAVVTAADADRLAVLLADLSRSTRPAASAPAQVPEATMSGRLWLVLGTCFVGLTAVLLLAGWGLTRRNSRAARLQQMVGRYGAGGAGAAVVQPRRDQSLADRSPIVGVVFGLAGRIAARESVGTRLAGMLQRANLRLTPTEWLVIELSVATAAGAATGLLLHHLLLGGVVGALLGLAATHGWLMISAARRTRAFSDRLPDALQLLASGVASGFGLSQALEAVAQGGPQPVADELAKAMVDARLGLPLTDALDRVALRMRSPDLELTVMSIAIQGEVGGNLAEVLRGIVATMRERAYLRRQIRTLSAEGRLSSYILIGLPIAMLGYLLLARRDYVRPLYTEPVGLVMSAVAALCLLVGVVVMHKMVKVDV